MPADRLPDPARPSPYDPARALGLVLAGAFLVAMVALAVAGAVRQFSPVPHWDQWDAVLDFVLRVQDGDTSVWWAQHNEHRIAVSRTLFWLDHALFGGLGAFLQVLNLVLVGAIALVFWRLVRARAGTARPARVELVVGALVAGWVFSWAQRDNLMWTFQSQFFLAQLVPLAAFVALARAVEPPGSRAFVLACVLGFVAIGTMANGVLVLPLLVVYALWTRQPARRVLVLAALAALAWWLYFRDYRSDPAQLSWSFVLQRRWKALIQYVLLYLGNPLNAMLGGGSPGRTAALVGGAAWFVLIVRAGLRCLRRDRAVALPLAMLFFAAYVVGSALAAGGGRLTVGANQSLTGRYATPGLMAWAVAFVLYAPIGVRAGLGRLARGLYWSALAVLAGAALVHQTHALDDVRDDLFERDLAVLALELGVHDEARIGKVYADAEVALGIAARASGRDLGVFGSAPFRGLRERIGTPAGAPTPVQGRLERAQEVTGETRFVRVRGWARGADGRPPRAVWMVDGVGSLVGCALTGRSRPQAPGLRDGLEGFLLAGHALEDVRIVLAPAD